MVDIFVLCQFLINMEQCMVFLICFCLSILAAGGELKKLSSGPQRLVVEMLV